MPKKRVKTRSSPRATKKTHNNSNLEEKLIHNMVELQKVQTNMAEKFEKLSNQLADLLNLFEMAARDFATQPHIQATEKDKDFLDKIDKLLDQNKTIAKGLTLMEEKMREKLYGGAPPGMPGPRPPRPPRGPPGY